jgi:hypothetical protein
MNIAQLSTKCGLVWVFTGILGSIGWWMDKDIAPIILLGTTIAGGLGAALDDKVK